MGLGNSPPVVSTPGISPLNGGVAPAGATLLLQCTATDDGAVGTLVAKVFAGADLTASPIFTSGNLVTAAAATVSGSANWAAPPTPASYTVVCLATDTGWPAASSSSSLGFSTAIATLPPTVSPVSGPTEVLVGSTSAFQVIASDPNTPPKPLTYAWSASGGTITADASNPASAKWLAPATAGAYELTVTVSNGDASTVSIASVTTALATYQGQLPVAVVAPRRLCESDGGGLFIVDGDQGTTGRVALLDPAGGIRGFATLPEPALALTYGAGFLWVTTTKGSLYKVDTRLGRTIGKVALAGGPFARPSGIAFDAANMALWVADTDARRVRVIRPDGATVAVLDGAGGAPLAAPLDVAIEPTAGRAWLLVGAAKAGLAPGEPAAAGSFVHTFALASRQYVASFVQSGTGPNQLTRAGGLTAARGKVYVSDIFQGTVQVLGPDGSFLGTVGAFGQGAGQLMNPMGLAGMANGDVAVANASLGRIDRFGDGASLPSCTGKACLTNPDWRPIATAPTQPGQGKGRPKGGKGQGGDRGGDGDRDGEGDGSGRDGGAPVVSATGPAQSPPGLVRLAAVATGGDCAFSWTQVAGPAVKLSSATAASPSFVARAVATYAFEVVARCGGVSSATGRLAVAVQNRPPLADAGRVMVVSPGATVRLDASFSTDANGDRLTFSWDQTLGRPLVGVQNGAALAATPQGPGLYAFQVTASDGRGGRAT
ncbi:MAG TPA: PKD domain-containing protein, partial [Anaeromyxobacter sp.]